MRVLVYALKFTTAFQHVLKNVKYDYYENKRVLASEPSDVALAQRTAA